MVGGVADWFAVTALFRRPLGLPIPHTAIIVERKDQFAATLGQFVQENFLNGDVLAERIRSAGPASRLAAWLSDEDNAARFAGHAADLVVTLAGTLRDEDVQSVLTAEVVRAAAAIEVAPLAGRAVGVMIAGGHHAGAVQRSRYGGRPLPRRPSRRAQGAVRDGGAPLAARRGLREGVRPAVCPVARAARRDGRRPGGRGEAAVRRVGRRSSRAAQDVTRAARARGKHQARPAGQRGAAGLDLAAVEEHQGDAARPGGRPRLGVPPPAGRRADRGGPQAQRRPRAAGEPGAGRRVGRPYPRRPVPRRAGRPGHRDHTAVGRRGDIDPAGTAAGA